MQAKVLFNSTNALFLQWQQGDDMPADLPGEIAASVAEETSDGKDDVHEPLRHRHNSSAKVISASPITTSKPTSPTTGV